VTSNFGKYSPPKWGGAFANLHRAIRGGVSGDVYAASLRHPNGAVVAPIADIRGQNEVGAIWRLRRALASGISSGLELWPSG
jgi:hypothetical protein